MTKIVDNPALLITEIAGQSIADLASKYGTPCYVYNAEIMAGRIAELAKFDVIRYAMKACSNLAVLDLMRRHGVVVDTVSLGEIERARASGYQTQHPQVPPIVYTADIFDRESLQSVIEQQISVNLGSPDMIDQYGEAYQAATQTGGQAPRREITLRINPGFGHGHSQKTNTGGEQSKHGIWHDQLQQSIDQAGRYGLVVTGLHMHIGSGTDLAHLSQVCDAMVQAATTVGPSVEMISAGGGLPIVYQQGEQEIDIDAYYQLWDQARQKLVQQFAHPVSLEIEPGRFLVAESGYLLAEIRAVKTMGDNCYYLLDAGFNNLARPILYGSYHPMAICPIQQPDLSRPTHEVVVGGPLCESGDIFTQEEGGFVSRRILPEAAIGDYLVIGCAGAYGAVMGSNYNSKPLAPEVLIENGTPHLIRTRQTFDDLVRGEQIPRD
jgi:diaminopimelate decarboxylase